MDHVMYFNFKYFLVLFFSLIINVSVAEEIRDYYAEPGLNPFKQTMQDLNESIDPFSGTLQQKYTDIVIPGNGGLDIRINRSYTSPQSDTTGTAASSAYGVGWTIHFGRIVTTESNADKLCAQGLFSVSTKDNPSLELPDGGRELLVQRDFDLFPELGANDLITRSNWKATCNLNGTGLIVTSPAGTVYTMNEYAGVTNGISIEPSWFTSRIEDVNGNWIAISYITSSTSAGHKMIDEITSSDGRLVKFNYIYPANDLAHLDTIVAHNQTSSAQTWKYNYLSVDGWGAYQLIEVVRPDGNNWQYDYNLRTDPLGKYGMNKVTYPQGGIVEYTYDNVIFNPGLDQVITTVVSSKTTSGTSVTPGTWTYNYAPGNYLIPNSTQKLDVTTVTTPTAKQEYFYYGEIANAPVWATGLLAQQVTYDVTGTTILDVVTNTWSGRKISNENYWHGRTRLDIGTQTPIMLSKSHWQDGVNYVTTFNNYDRFGNPAQIVESGNYEVRTTDYLYYTDPTNWIISDKVSSETIQGIGSIIREFNLDGTLKNESKYGVLTEYTYHSTGDLATVTDAKGKALGYNTKFNDYYRGIARQEIHPVTASKNITTSKVVNLTGTVKSITNGRSFTKNFTYDNLNRLKTITYPKAGSSPVSINYTATSKTLTRGNLQQSSTVNGFGQTITTTINDTLNNITISTTQDYDAIGQLTFKSHPNDTIGTSFQYDALGRQTRIDHPDTTYRVFDHLLGNDLMITDERGNQTTYSYRAFSNPSEKSLIRIVSPELISTSIYRNHLDKITRVWQGETGGLGYQRVYEYTSNYFLNSITNPETGITVLGRDEIGNMTSKQVGLSLATAYSYDFQNRNTFIDYPSTTADVTFAYDDNGNSVQVENQNSTRVYLYDDNDNLTTETISIGQTDSILEYSYTDLDYVDTLTYPSNKIVNYSPDALGRPSQMAPYLTNVSYYPSGQTKQLSYANGQVTDYTLNNRLWVEGISVGNVNQIVGLTYGYDGLGNISNITDSIDTLNDRTFGYDGVNRLTSAEGQWGVGNYTYDFQSNIKTKIIGNHNLTYYYSNNKLIGVRGSANQDFFYDDYGNQTSNINSDLGYNEASQLKTSLNWGIVPAGVNPASSYLYDGNGMRVNTVNGATTTDYVFASNGNLMREYGALASQEKEYFYLGSQLIAKATRTPDPIPAQPSSVVVPTIDADGDFVITWTAATGIVHWYELEEATQADFSDATNVYKSLELSAALTSRAVGYYYYRVRACNLDGCSPYTSGANQLVVGLPTAKAGIDQTVTENSNVTLDASASTSNAASITIYQWRQTAGPKVTLVNSNAAIATFLAPFVTQQSLVTFEILVTDANANTSTDSINITVSYADTDTDGLSDAWEYYFFNSLLPNSTDDIDGDGVSNYEELVFGYNPTQTQGPAPAQNIEMLSLYKQNNIAWAPVLGATSYNLYWSTTSNITIQNATKITGTSSPFYHTDLTNGSAYYYIVTAVNQFGESIPSRTVSSIPKPSWTAPYTLISEVTDSTIGLYMTPGGNASVYWYDYFNTHSTVFSDYDVVNSWRQSIGPLFGQGSNPPPLATNKHGEKAMAWVENVGSNVGNVFVSLYTPNNGWSSPQQITSNTLNTTVFSSPNVAINNDGSVTVVWLHRPYGLPASINSRRYSKLAGWLDSELVDQNDSGFAGLQKIDLGIDDAGNAIATWYRTELVPGSYSNQHAVHTSRYINGRGWLNRKFLTENIPWVALDLRLDMNSKGDAIISWIIEGEYNPYSTVVYAVNFSPDTGWTAPEIVSVAENDVRANDVAIKLSNSGDAIIAWQHAYPNTGIDELYANRYSQLTGWQGPEFLEVVNSNTAISPKLAIDNLGNALVIWSERNPDAVNIYLPQYTAMAKRFSVLNGWHLEEDIINIHGFTPGNSKLEESDDGFVSLLMTRGSINNSLQILHTQIGNGDNLLAPTLTVPNDTSLEATGILTSVEVGVATALDINGEAIVPTPSLIGPFGVGVNNINWTAMDSAGNTTVIPQSVVIKDTTPPILTIPSDIVHYVSTTKSVNIDIGVASGTDIFPVTITNDAPPLFPFGESIVTWKATDTNLQQSQLTQNVSIQFAPGMPSANAASDQVVIENATVILDASNSIDLNGSIIDYNWLQISGPTVLISGSNTVTGTFVAPNVSVTTMLEFELSVTDNEGNTTKDYVIINVKPLSLNTAPVANAGEYQTVTEGSLVTLDATGSFDEDGKIVTYAWSQYYGPQITISDPTSIITTFVAPAVDIDTSIIISLVVTDSNGATGLVRTIITVQDGVLDTINPVVIAPAAITTEATAQLTTVTLGTASANDDVDGALVAIADNTGPFSVGTHTVTWSATDAAGNVGTATQTVTVTDTTAPTVIVAALQTVEATGQLTPVILGAATATDLVDGAITPTPSLSSPFTVGTHIVIWTATDAAGNMGSAAQLVTITDSTAPIVTVPVNITTEATATLTPVSLGTASANDSVDGALIPTANNTGPFSIGSHTITWSVTDAAGNVGSATQIVTITDTTAPIVTAPANVSVTSTGALTTVNLGSATASDLVDGSLTPTADNVGPFAVGTHTVTWSAPDAAGNVGTATQVVTILDGTVADTTAPVVTAPSNITTEATGTLTAVTLGTATASDLVDGTLTPTADNVGPYAVGTHTVTWSATDSAGNVGTATQTVTITDTTAPVVTAPTAITVEANATLTTVALGTAAANDSVDGTLTTTADNVGPYAVGTHTITWSATDAAGNVGTATQLVTVQDTTPPTLTVPADVAVISDVAIAADIGTATATDIFTPVTVTNNAPAIFPVGVTTVTWTATDANDNVSTATQTVTVEVPPGVNLTLDNTSPQTVGAVVNLSATTVGVTGSYDYRFRVKGDSTGNVWQVLQGYSATSTYSWNTTSYPGKNRVQVQARPAGTRDTPLRKAKTFWVNSVDAAQAVDYSTNIASPQITGATVAINAQASGGAGSYEYQFRVRKAGVGNAWVVLQDWSTLSTTSWNTTGYLGRHRIQVKARNVNSTDLAVRIVRNFWVNSANPATSAAIATDLTSPQTVGSTVVVTGTGQGGTGNYDYRFRIKGPGTGDVWQVLQDWSAVNTTSWNTTGYVGSHRVQVQLKNAGTDDRPVRKALTFDVQ